MYLDTIAFPSFLKPICVFQFCRLHWPRLRILKTPQQFYWPQIWDPLVPELIGRTKEAPLSLAGRSRGGDILTQGATTNIFGPVSECFKVVHIRTVIWTSQFMLGRSLFAPTTFWIHRPACGLVSPDKEYDKIYSGRGNVAAYIGTGTHKCKFSSWSICWSRLHQLRQVKWKRFDFFICESIFMFQVPILYSILPLMWKWRWMEWSVSSISTTFSRVIEMFTVTGIGVTSVALSMGGIFML